MNDETIQTITLNLGSASEMCINAPVVETVLHCGCATEIIDGTAPVVPTVPISGQAQELLQPSNSASVVSGESTQR